MNLSPIVLFVYNRPWHTRQTLEALSLNDLADESTLYIYADGPKNDANQNQIQQILEVRSIIRERLWCKEVHILERAENVGLASNIIDGVTNVVNRHGRIIVLEDDIVASRGFLKYMNDALAMYSDEEKVMHVSSYIPAIGENLPETYFYNQTSCWGWGTWQVAWKHYQSNAEILLHKIKSSSRIFEFDLDGSYPFSLHLELNISGVMNTWAVKWHASVFLLSGLCLHPKKSLVQNIGNDSSGTHCGLSLIYKVDTITQITVSPITLKENSEIRKKMVDFNFNSGFQAVPFSPFSIHERCIKEKSLSPDNVVEKYLAQFQINTCHFFNGLSKISIFKCPQTGYRFYYPYNLAGDGIFYEYFQKFDWYYMPWRWEHEQALTFIRPGMKILEVGCGSGGFIKEVKRRVDNVSLIGLELNQKAVDIAKAEKLNVFPQILQEHAKINVETYDVVCSFQVLEHIAEVKSFLEAKVKVLKRGGILILAVPNNDSFRKYDWENDVLNMPPHHMGLWNPRSLESLTFFYPIKLVKQINEPLQQYHLNWYLNILEKRICKKGKLLSTIFYYFKIKKIAHKLLTYFPGLVVGHTTIAIYQKAI